MTRVANARPTPVSHLQISSGRGPIEARRFVRLLADHIACFSGGLALGAAPSFIGPVDAPLSATIVVDTATGSSPAALRWVGTHVLLAPLRGRGGRKRWFVEVRPFSDAVGVQHGAASVDVRITAARAGGPGGQNVNKRATAVRVVDRVSGIAVRASGQRSQAQNRVTALERLQERLHEREAAAMAQAGAERRAAHDAVTRGAARFTWRLDSDGRLMGGE